MPDSIMTGDFAAQPQPQILLNGAQMRDLWSAYEAARNRYREDDPATATSFNEAQGRIFDARTADPEGVAIKLKAYEETGGHPANVLSGIIRDLSLPARGPSLAEFAKALAAAAEPHVEEGGSITSRADLVDALAPLIGHYTIADAVCAIGLLRTATHVVAQEDGGDDPLFAVLSILEDFASLADAADADSAAARAHLIEKAAEDDAWDLGSANMRAASRNAASDMRSMQKGEFRPRIFGGTFVSQIQYPGWLLNAIENSEGGEASSEYASSVHAARHETEASAS